MVIQWPLINYFRMDDKFSNVGVESMLTKCPHYSRIGHQAVKMGDEVLILGGTGPFG